MEGSWRVEQENSKGSPFDKALTFQFMCFCSGIRNWSMAAAYSLQFFLWLIFLLFLECVPGGEVSLMNPCGIYRCPAGFICVLRFDLLSVKVSTRSRPLGLGRAGRLFPTAPSVETNYSLYCQNTHF